MDSVILVGAIVVLVFLGAFLIGFITFSCELLAKELNTDYIVKGRDCLLEVNGAFVRVKDLIQIGEGVGK